MAIVSNSSKIAGYVYGFRVASDIPLPELIQDASAAYSCNQIEICINAGPVPEPTVIDPLDTRHYIDGCPEKLLINIPNTMRMMVVSGYSITYQALQDVQADEVRLYLLGSGLGALLMQRGFVVIHGNAVLKAKDDGAIICMGESGAGKSTTAIALMQRGLKVLSDDVCPIGPDGFVHPGIARAKLWGDSAAHLGVDTSNLKRIRSVDAKYNLPLGSAHCITPQKIRAMFWLVPEDTDSVSIAPIEGMDKFTILHNNVYRPEYLHALGLRSAYLKQISEIAAKTLMFRVSRPVDGFEIDKVVDAVLSQ